jgi:putative ABC transport system ATP-binding protein
MICALSSIITIRDLSKVYRIGSEKVKALGNINLAIEKGEICCILGPSGSGKSTLSISSRAGKALARQRTYRKTNISKLSEDQLAGFRQKNIGFVFQSYNLIPTMTALENVAMPLLFRGVSRSAREREAAGMSKRWAFQPMRHRPVEMSAASSSARRIARAFVASRPSFLQTSPPETSTAAPRSTSCAADSDVARLCITFVLVTHNRSWHSTRPHQHAARRRGGRRRPKRAARLSRRTPAAFARRR